MSQSPSFITLPVSSSLEELWESFAFPLAEVAGGPAYHVQGVYRRLNAALSSIAQRGAWQKDFSFGVPENGWMPFVWESRQGTWTRRHWRVSGVLRFFNGRLTIKEVIVAVESTAQRDRGIIEWTAFAGGPLNRILEDRLSWVLAQFGASVLAREPSSLAWRLVSSERDEQQYDEEGYPTESEWELRRNWAWASPFGEVEWAEDPAYGRGWLGASHEAKAELIGLWIEGVEPSPEFDDSLPVSGPIPEPEDPWGLIGRARFIAARDPRLYRKVADIIGHLPPHPLSPAEKAAKWRQLKEELPDLAGRALGSTAEWPTRPIAPPKEPTPEPLAEWEVELLEGLSS